MGPATPCPLQHFQPPHRPGHRHVPLDHSHLPHHVPFSQSSRRIHVHLPKPPLLSGGLAVHLQPPQNQSRHPRPWAAHPTLTDHHNDNNHDHSSNPQPTVHSTTTTTTNTATTPVPFHNPTPPLGQPSNVKMPLLQPTKPLEAHLQHTHHNTPPTTNRSNHTTRISHPAKRNRRITAPPPHSPLHPPPTTSEFTASPTDKRTLPHQLPRYNLPQPLDLVEPCHPQHPSHRSTTANIPTTTPLATCRPILPINVTTTPGSTTRSTTTRSLSMFCLARKNVGNWSRC